MDLIEHYGEINEEVRISNEITLEQLEKIKDFVNKYWPEKSWGEFRNVVLRGFEENKESIVLWVMHTAKGYLNLDKLELRIDGKLYDRQGIEVYI